MKIDRLLLGALLLGVVLGMGLLAERLSPQDPVARDRHLALDPPGRFHPFGTDEAGRDVLARVVHAGRFALLACAPASLLASMIALLFVRLAAAAPDRTRRIAESALERLALVPSAALALIAAQFFICDTPAALALLLGSTTWGPVGGRMLGRSAAPGSLGGALRAILGLSAAEAVRRIPLLLVLESGLSWLGLGLAPPTPSWGAMIREGARHFPDGWWAATFPAVGLLGTVLAFRLTGEALRPPSQIHVTSDDRGSVQEDLRRVRDGERELL